MKTISMSEFRQQTAAILQVVKQGRTFLLTYRGSPVARLLPISSRTISADDPFYKLNTLASEAGTSVTNTKLDQLLYR